jgi:hypothetical protein
MAAAAMAAWVGLLGAAAGTSGVLTEAHG